MDAPGPLAVSVTQRPSRVAFVLRRLGGLVVVLVAVSLLVFSLLYLAPGSPEQVLLGAKTADPETIHAIREEYNLNDPFLVRYGKWAEGALHLDFGTSTRTSEPVFQGITQRLGLTAQLAGLGFLLTMLLGLPLGILAAARQRQRRPSARALLDRRRERARLRERDPAPLPLRGRARLVPDFGQGEASPTGCTISCCPRSRSR